MITKIASSVVLFLINVATATYKMEDRVYILTDSNFNAFIKDHKYVFVDFHLPWCGWCKKVAPHVDQLAVELESMKPTIVVAKMDCSTNEKIKTKLGVDKFPSLTLWKFGKKTTYDPVELPDTKALLEWVGTEISLEKVPERTNSWIPPSLTNIKVSTMYFPIFVVSLLLTLKIVRRLISPTVKEQKAE